MKSAYYDYQNYLDYYIVNNYGFISANRFAETPSSDAENINYMFCNSLFREMEDTALATRHFGEVASEESIEKMKPILAYIQNLALGDPDDVSDAYDNPLVSQYGFVYCSYLPEQEDALYYQTALITCKETKEAYFWYQKRDGSERWTDLSDYFEWADTELSQFFMQSFNIFIIK